MVSNNHNSKLYLIFVFAVLIVLLSKPIAAPSDPPGSCNCAIVGTGYINQGSYCGVANNGDHCWATYEPNCGTIIDPQYPLIISDCSCNCIGPEPACDSEGPNPDTMPCPKQAGVCAGSYQTCTNNQWPGCDNTIYNNWATSHGWTYESGVESTCGDFKDNDCDGKEDCEDPGCGGLDECDYFIKKAYSAMSVQYQEKTWDELENLTYTRTDKFGNLKYVVNYFGYSGGPIQDSTKYYYDLLGNLEQIYDAEDRYLETNEFDRLSRLTHSHNIDMGEKWYKYDENDNIIYIRNSLNQETCYEYDDIDRLEFVYYDTYNNINEDCSGSPNPAIEYQYDSGCSNSNYYALGKLCKVIDSSGSTEFGYDNRGRITEQKTTIEVEEEMTKEYEIAYSYDSAGNLIHMNLPDGTGIFYNYNLLGQVENMHIDDNSFADFYYTPTSRIEFIDYANDVNGYFGYNARDWLDFVMYTPPGVSLPGGFYQRQYIYDDVGNVLEIYKGPKVGINQIGEYSYDEMYRLQRIDDQNSHYPFESVKYNYDSVGNRLERVTNETSTETFNYAPNTNRLSSVTMPGSTLIQMGYNLVGNMETKQEDEHYYEYEYDGNNMLTEFRVDSEVKETYKYDYQNRRVVKKDIDDESVSIYVYDIYGNNVYKQRFYNEEGGCNPNMFNWEDAKVLFSNGAYDNYVAMMDSNGMMMIEGFISEEPLSGEMFEVLNQYDDPVLQIDSEGNLYTPYLFENIYSMSPIPEDELVFKAGEEVVGLINVNDGTFLLKSCIYEDYDF